MTKRRTRTRSQAAQRGWETRRANERRRELERQRRSDAARRGWETRRRRERERPPEPPDVVDDFAGEWEIGVDYDAAAGRGSDVDINIRLSRVDGMLFSSTEAAQALAEFRTRVQNGDRNPIPPGYRMAAINWRRPRGGTGGWRPRGGSGTQGDLAMFNAVLYATAGDDSAWREPQPHGIVRLGSVKP